MSLSIKPLTGYVMMLLDLPLTGYWFEYDWVFENVKSLTKICLTVTAWLYGASYISLQKLFCSSRTITLQIWWIDIQSSPNYFSFKNTEKPPLHITQASVFCQFELLFKFKRNKQAWTLSLFFILSNISFIFVCYVWV